MRRRGNIFPMPHSSKSTEPWHSFLLEVDRDGHRERKHARGRKGEREEKNTQLGCIGADVVVTLLYGCAGDPPDLGCVADRPGEQRRAPGWKTLAVRGPVALQQEINRKQDLSGFRQCGQVARRTTQDRRIENVPVCLPALHGFAPLNHYDHSRLVTKKARTQRNNTGARPRTRPRPYPATPRRKVPVAQLSGRPRQKFLAQRMKKNFAGQLGKKIHKTRRP